MFADAVRQTSNDLTDALLFDIMVRVQTVSNYHATCDDAHRLFFSRIAFLEKQRKEANAISALVRKQIVDHHVPNEDDALFYK